MTQQPITHDITMSPATIYAIECTRLVMLAEKRLAAATRKLNNALVQIPDIDTPDYFLAVTELRRQR